MFSYFFPSSKSLKDSNPSTPKGGKLEEGGPLKKWPSALTVFQVNQLQQSFKKFDRNNDGQISLEELQVVLRNLGDGFDLPSLKEMMDKADTNSDGYICIEEFMDMTAATTKDGGRQEDLLALFEIFDHDNDGFISPKDLLGMMHRMREERMTLEDCVKMIKAVDKDKDGKCDFAEFSSMMEGA
eukprot:TRINITY_DN22040_c0_g1_i1.p1 TRINITY_DN22040_c0_g1~~TRINITY_DN22040_c0_g1_i1.p1  ORF type:complete len:184 (-),score=45.34 TRINITY_DN22040_c0_g1_i1:1181-1732(-)